MHERILTLLPRLWLRSLTMASVYFGRRARSEQAQWPAVVTWKDAEMLCAGPTWSSAASGTRLTHSSTFVQVILFLEKDGTN
jgi:hypothetical protein